MHASIRNLSGRAAKISLLTMAGQIVMFASIPLLTRIYSPAEFGLFMVYLSAVNILGTIVSLRFSAYLYLAASEDETSATFKLVICSVAVTSGLVFISGYFCLDMTNESNRMLLYSVIAGSGVTALVETLNAWAVRSGQLHDFAVGRFVQLALTAFMQVSLGLVHATGETMVASHIISLICLMAFLGMRVLTREDRTRILGLPMRDVFAVARREYKFPVFDLPAIFIETAIVNFPAIVIKVMFGDAVAGHFGVAARLLGAPVALLAAPLNNVFVHEASNNLCPDHTVPMARRLLLLSALFVSLPVLIVGFAAPYLAESILGKDWQPAGEMTEALSIFVASQALATPLLDTTTLFRRQELRLLLAAAAAVFTFGPLLICGLLGFDPLLAVFAMAVGGSLGYICRLVAALWMLNGGPSTQTRADSKADTGHAFASGWKRAAQPDAVD